MIRRIKRTRKLNESLESISVLKDALEHIKDARELMTEAATELAKSLLVIQKAKNKKILHSDEFKNITTDAPNYLEFILSDLREYLDIEDENIKNLSNNVIVPVQRCLEKMK